LISPVEKPKEEAGKYLKMPQSLFFENIGRNKAVFRATVGNEITGFAIRTGLL
jgi:hypothetical protein